MTPEQTTIPGTETELSEAVDRFLKAKASVDESAASRDEAGEEVLRMMKELGKQSVKHDGKLLTIRHFDSKDTLSVGTSKW